MTDVHGYARLGENPKLKYIPGNTTSEARPIAEVRLCLSNFRKRGDDEYEDRGFWVDATLWNEQAEIVARNFRQGDKVYVVGDLSSGHWVDKDSGESRSRPELRVALIFPDLRSLESFRYKPRAQNTPNTRESVQPLSDDASAPDPTQDSDIPFSEGVHPVTGPESAPNPSRGKKRSAA
jgi:single-strand DNA-binding protein